MSWTEKFFNFMKERHAIYLSRATGKPKPWTTDRILQQWKFCNVYRELDRTTIFMRENITNPNAGAPADLMIFNCAYFRFIGDSAPFERGDLPMFIEHFPSVRASLKQNIRRALNHDKKVFTSAYQVLHGGRTTPKEIYVVDLVLDSLWTNRNRAAEPGVRANTLQETFKALYPLCGFGGTGFMAYEVVSDLRRTSFYKQTPMDTRTWANAGPGTVRALNRMLGRPLSRTMQQQESNRLMRYLLTIADYGAWPNDQEYPRLEMREIEHALCDFDKYERVRNGEGHMRNRYQGDEANSSDRAGRSPDGFSII